MKMQFLLTAALVTSSLALVGCSGSSSSDPNALNATSVSSASGTLSALEGLLDSIDTTSSRLSTRSQQNQGPQAGDASVLGCHVKQDRDRAFNELKRIQEPLCFIESLEEASSDFSVPDGDYNYFEITLPAGFDGPNTGEESFLIRIGKFTENGNNVLAYQMFEDGAQREDFKVTEIEGGVHVFTSHKFTFVDPSDQSQTEQVGLGSFEVTAKGESTDDLTSAEITAKFQDPFGCGSMSISADKTVPKYSMEGYFSGNFGEFSHSSGVCAHVSQGEGSGKVGGTAQFPPWNDPNDGKFYCPDPNETPQNPLPPVEVASTATCNETFEHTEDFVRQGTGETAQCVIDASPNSDLQALVANCSLGTACSDPVDFQTTWDGAAPSGFTSINLADFLTEVEACITKHEADDQQNHDSCEQQRLEDEASKL